MKRGPRGSKRLQLGIPCPAVVRLSAVGLGVIFFCVSCLLIPTAPHDFRGKRIDKASMEFLEIGKTTKEEVLLRLGGPDASEAFERWFRYESEFTWLYLLLLPHPHEVIPLTKRSYVLIHFDESGRVERVESNIK